MLRLFLIHLILHVQYSFYEASPSIGADVRMAYLEELSFVVSIGHKIHKDVEDRIKIESIFCGGSLITTKLVLTAAHCVSKKDYRNIVVNVGSIDVLKSQPYGIEWWMTYSQWAAKKLPAKYNPDVIHDIATIKIRGTISNIKLPKISYIPDADLYNKAVRTAGWGVLEDNKKPRYMRIADLIVKSPHQCEPFLRNPDPFLRNLLPQMQLCTSSARGTATTHGDSGSPLLRGNDTIVGVNSVFCNPQLCSSLSSYRNLHSSVNAYEEFIEALKQT